MVDRPRLAPVAPGFAATRDALHQVAYFAVAPRRYQAVGRLGLTALPGGFGTPWFDGGRGRERIRMDGDVLVVEAGGGERRTRPSSVRDACRFIGIEWRESWFETFREPLQPRHPDRPLHVDPDAAAAMAAWFAFGTAALEALRATPGAQEPSTVQLWPEHFDLSIELGSAAAGTRASYGASPGDADHDQPYLYVAPAGDHPVGNFWDDRAFGGASLSHDELLASDDPGAAAVSFLRRGHHLLTAA